MTTVRAAVLEGIGEPLRLAEVDLRPPADGEVLVRIAVAGVCHSDLLYMNGTLKHRLPVILGHEGSGVVQAVGPGVRSVRPGDHVVLLWRSTCGRCEACSAGRAPLCPGGRAMRSAGTLMDGTSRLSLDGEPLHHFLGLSCFAEMAIVNEEALLVVAQDIPLDLVAIAGCAVITGAGAIFNAGRVRPGDRVLVIGAGGVGVGAIAAAGAAGAARIVAVDRVAARLDFAASFGATDLVVGDAVSAADDVRRLMPEGVDVAIEAAGTPDAIRLAIDLIGPGGTAVLVGGHGDEAIGTFAARDLVVNEKSVVGSIAGTMRPAADFRRLFDLYRAGRLPIDRMIGRRYPLSAINAAYTDLASGPIGRSIVEIAPDLL